ncbi:MAG: hypothetical protein ACTSRG_24040 [Candidatus Helarchaeota archaeon]
MKYFQDPLIFLFYTSVLVFILIFGILTLKRKPITFRSDRFFYLFIFAEVIVFSIFLYRLFFDIPLFEVFDYLNYIWSVIFIPICTFPSLLINYRNIFRSLDVYNVTYQILYDSFAELLKRNNISYKEINGNFILQDLNAEIDIKIKPLKYAIIYFGVKDKKIRKKMMSDLKTIFNMKRIDSFPIYSLLIIIACCVTIILYLNFWFLF